MPRASLGSKDAVAVSLGFQEGVLEITAAVTKVHQYPPNSQTGEQGEPFACVQLTGVRCDENGERTSTEEIKEEFGIGKLEKFHPGKASGPDDEDPEDLGTEVDTEGNCVYVAEESAHLNTNSKWIKFATELEGKGFKPEILGRGYMPDLVGLVFKCHTETMPRTPGYTGKKDPTKLVVDKILRFPYDGKKKAAAKPAAKPAAGAKAPAPAKAPAAAPASGDAASLALAYLTEMVSEQNGNTVERKKLQTGVQTKLMRNKIPVGQHKPVLELVKSDEWLKEQTGVDPESEDAPLWGKIVIDWDADPQTATFNAE